MISVSGGTLTHCIVSAQTWIRMHVEKQSLLRVHIDNNESDLVAEDSGVRFAC